MGKLTVLALRIVLAVVLAGSLFVQAVMVPLLAIDLRRRPGRRRPCASRSSSSSSWAS